MTKETFFDIQSDLTALKILIYREYLSDYLPKVLMQYGKCVIADFFCGPGKNGNQDGSPLVLLDVARKTLEQPVLKRKHPDAEIVIIFSDAEKNCCDDLTGHLQKLQLPKQIKVLGPYCESFNSIKTKAFDVFKGTKVPRFFFLDPFTYSLIRIKDVKELMDVFAVEVLLFLPTHHAYRFVKSADKTSKLKAFLEEFTAKGCSNYADINDFNESIRQRLLKQISLEYVRAVGLDDGAKKNALFYLTKHITGMLLMNKLVWSIAKDGLNIKAKREPTLFKVSTTSKNYEFKKNEFREYLKEKKRIGNREIIDFVAQNCFDTTCATDILKEMKNQELIDVDYKRKDKKRGFYVADNNWDKDLAIIVYLKEKNVI